MSALRAVPWVRRAMTSAERAEVLSLPNELTVYLWPTAYWNDRTWFARINRNEEVLAETAGHPSPMAAFREARAQLAERVG